MPIKDLNSNKLKKGDKPFSKTFFLVLFIGSVLCSIFVSSVSLNLSFIFIILSLIFLTQFFLKQTGKSFAEVFLDQSSGRPSKCPMCGTSLRPSNRSLFTQRIVAGGGNRSLLGKCPKCGFEIAPVDKNEV